jgi:hypothetical protein
LHQIEQKYSNFSNLFAGVLHQFFECLYDIDVITEDALLAWEKCDDPAEAEGKGVAIKSTTQFFTWLKEADDEDEDDSEKDEGIE